MILKIQIIAGQFHDIEVEETSTVQEVKVFC